MRTKSPETTAREDGPSCREAAELLPWLVNGSLAEDERRFLGGHLAACASCRQELEETVRAWEVLTQHLPSLTLAEYSQGLPTRELSRERIERHLALCPSCREELELAMSAEVVELAPARSRSGARRHLRTSAGRGRAGRRRLLAAAASIALTLLSGGMIWKLRDEGPDTSSPVIRSAAHHDEEDSRLSGSADGQAPETAMLFVDGFESSDMAGWTSGRH